MTTVQIIRDFAKNWGIETITYNYKGTPCIALIVKENPLMVMAQLGSYIGSELPLSQIKNAMIKRMNGAYFDSTKKLVVFPKVWEE